MGFIFRVGVASRHSVLGDRLHSNVFISSGRILLFSFVNAFAFFLNLCFLSVYTSAYLVWVISCYIDLNETAQERPTLY